MYVARMHIGRLPTVARCDSRRQTGTFRRARLGTLSLIVGVTTALGCGVPSGVEESEPGTAPTVSQDASDACRDSGAFSPSGLTIIGGDQVILPSSRCGKKKPIGEALGANGRHVLFVNYEGADIRVGDNSLENDGIRDTGFKNQGVVELDGFDPANDKRSEAIMKIHKQVQKWYADVDVDVVMSRPLSGDYQMTLVGGDKSDIGLGGSIVGISPGDCKNNNETNLNFAFSRSLRENPDQVAVTIAHEAGHAYGLGHVQNMKDIMYPSVSVVDGFLGGLAADAGPCGFKMGDYQDSKKVLIENLGARQGEAPGTGSPPTLKLLSPQEGESVGKDLTIAVQSAAEKGIDHITLSVSRVDGGKARGAHPVAELRPPQSAAQIRLSSAGSYQVTATAYDRAGNITQSQVRFVAATPTCALPNDCAPGQKCQNNTCVTPAPTPPSPTGMGDDGLRPYGQACDKSSDCKGGLCAITSVGQICTHYCTTDRLCAGGLECVDGTCLPQMYSRATPKVGALGGKCSRNQDCSTGECSAPSADPKAPRYCTKVCDAEVGWSCPATMECVQTDGATGNKTRCVTLGTGAMGEGASGCSVADPAAASESSAVRLFGGSAALVLLGLWAATRRRRGGPAL